MGDALYELFAWPVEQIQRGGKRAAVTAIILGLLLVPCGLWLCFGFLGPDRYWPIMLSVSFFGLTLAAAGLASFVGTQAKLLSALEGDHDVKGPSPDAPVMRAGIPFWVCSSCKIVREGANTMERCDECASMVDFIAIETEADRKLAVAMLS